MSTRDVIADVLSRAYDGKPLDAQSPEHAAPHTEAADLLLAADGESTRAEVLAEAEAAVREMCDLSWDTLKAASVVGPLTAFRYAADRLHAMADESTQPAELTVYRAAYEHDITPLETYTLRAAARCHCEDEALAGLARDERELRWETDPDEPEVEELHVDGQASGYTVTAVAIPSEYDTDGDA